MTYQAFKSEVLDKGFDLDGSFGWQCWDGYAKWCQYVGVPYANCTVSGYVKDIWEQRQTNGTLTYFDEVPINSLGAGDVVVFKVSQSTPYSHIAVFDSDAGNGWGLFLGQNQEGKYRHANGGSSFNLAKLPYSALYPTAFRLKSSYQKGKQGLGIPTKRVNGDLFSGLVTHVDPNVMNADNNRARVNLIVIHHNAGTSDEAARRTWYVATGVGTSAHYQVADDKIWGCVGEESVAYHAGDYPTNQRSIGIEHLNNSGAPNWTISEATYRNSAKLIADICQRYGIPIDRNHIVPHQSISATACPGDIDLDKLVRMAQEVAKGASLAKSETVAQSGSFRVKVVVKDLNVRKAPSLSAAKSGVAKMGVYTITETKTADGHEWGKLKSGAGWIALTYVKRL
ncbi:peptidoglycan recognition protein family protein [Streptococcus cuniculipharyngis]|nr:peptidoglycan recognition family protein [Streptococcus cuniculipharyngis]